MPFTIKAVIWFSWSYFFPFILITNNIYDNEEVHYYSWVQTQTDFFRPYHLLGCSRNYS